jgi:hypothetical protein
MLEIEPEAMPYCKTVLKFPVRKTGKCFNCRQIIYILKFNI